MQTRPFQVSLICSSCPSDRDFASGFLQIPLHNGHPCHWLVVPTTKPTADFHRQVIAHAGHTLKNKCLQCRHLFYTILGSRLTLGSSFLKSLLFNNLFSNTPIIAAKLKPVILTLSVTGIPITIPLLCK